MLSFFVLLPHMTVFSSHMSWSRRRGKFQASILLFKYNRQSLHVVVRPDNEVDVSHKNSNNTKQYKFMMDIMHFDMINHI